KVQGPARIAHRSGQRQSFVDFHSIDVHGHQPGCHVIIRYFRGHIASDEVGDFLGSQGLAIPLLLDDLARIDHSFAFCPGTGSALSSHAVYQRLLSIVAARASSFVMRSVPLARGCCGLNSPVFSSSYTSSSSPKLCVKYCLIESHTLLSRCGG